MAYRTMWCGADIVARLGQAGVIAILGLLFTASVEAGNEADTASLVEIIAKARLDAHRVTNESSRLVLLQNLAAADARVGNLRTAQSEAERLEPLVKAAPHYGDCNYIFVEILRAQARLGDYRAAYRTMERIGRNKDEAHYALAEEMARRGDFDQAQVAIEMTTRADNLRRRAQVVLELAVAAANSGDWTAPLLFDKTEKLSAHLLREAGVQAATVELTLDVAARMQACGAPTVAARIFAESRSLIGATADDSRRQQYLYTLAAAAARGGDFDLASQVDEQITDPMRLAQARAAIVSAYLHGGLEQTDAALKAASNIPFLEQRISSLALIASAQGRKGQKEAARKTIQTGEQLMQYASDDFKPWGYLNLAAAEYETGQKARAGRLCDEAIRLSAKFTVHPERERGLLYRNVARLRASFGDEVGALTTVKRSGDGSLFEDVTEEQAQAGYGQSAMKWIMRLRDPEQRAGALLGFVRGVLDRQQKSRPGNSAHPRCQ